MVKVSLALPNGSTPLQFEARVMRTVGTDRMGIEFKNLGAKESSQLQEFLLPLILAAA